MGKTYISEIDGKYYAFSANVEQNQVYSIGRDNPESGRWCAKWNSAGIKYVASASPSRAAAVAKARRAGDYQGEV